MSTQRTTRNDPFRSRRLGALSLNALAEGQRSVPFIPSGRPSAILRTGIALVSLWLIGLVQVSFQPKGANGYLWAGEKEVSVDTSQPWQDSESAKSKTPDSLRLVPADVTLPRVGATQRFLVMAAYGKDFERDVTRRSQLLVSESSRAEIDSSGHLHALQSGELLLEARLGDRMARARIRVRPDASQPPAAFTPDVVSLLTKHGCNRGDCHGGVKGRGGFKLSLNGLNPAADYRSILQGGSYRVLEPEPAPPLEPRIDRKRPADSPLLLKPVLAVPHAGGLLFTADSIDYRRILQWIERGAPYGDPSQSFEQVEIFPTVTTLDPAEQHQLLITARLENGAVLDLTKEARYEVRNPDIVQVSPQGLMRAQQMGETVVLARAAGQTLSTRVRVLASRLTDYPEIPRHNLIDDYVFATLEKFHIVPSDLSSDQEFLRRACLDVTGTLPPPQRVRDFLADTHPDKRERLIETLLSSPEYLDYWTFRFSDFFRVIYQDAFTYGAWVRESLAQNRPYDEMVRQRIAAQGSSEPTQPL